MVMNQPNSGGLYTQYRDSLLRVGWVYPQYKELINPGTNDYIQPMLGSGIQQRSWDPTKIMGSNKGHGIQQRSWDPTKVMGSNKGHGIQQRSWDPTQVWVDYACSAWSLPDNTRSDFCRNFRISNVGEKKTGRFNVEDLGLSNYLYQS